MQQKHQLMTSVDCLVHEISLVIICLLLLVVSSTSCHYYYTGLTLIQEYSLPY